LMANETAATVKGKLQGFPVGPSHLNPRGATDFEARFARSRTFQTL
jgi:hypothetical protein